MESTAWTTDIGAKARAATWKNQALVATAMPIANHLEENRFLTVRSGWRMSTCAASLAPLCLNRKPSCVTTAHKSARNMPEVQHEIEKEDRRGLHGPRANRSISPSVPKAPALSPHQTNVHATAMKPSAPLLLIDVDGVISLFGFDQTEPPEGRFTFVDGLPHYLSATAAGHLDRLHPTFECVWCTGWEDRADEHLPYLLGVPRGWRHLTFPQEPLPDAHWKLSAIEAYAGPDRPWPGSTTLTTTRATPGRAGAQGPTLLVATDPAVGITGEHVETLLSWGPATSG